MKYFCVSTFFAIIALASSGPMEDAIRACMDQEGASQAEAQGMQKMEMPETRTQKCFYACMFEKIGYSDGQRFDTDRFLQIGESHGKNDPKMLDAFRAMADRCDGTENDDRCELAADIVACMRGDQ